MNAQTLSTLSGIINTLTDRELDQVSTLVRGRREQLKMVLAADMREQLDRGTRVRLAGNLRPMYLLGLEGEIVGPVGPDDRVPVELDTPAAAGRYVDRQTGELRAPVTCLEVIS